MPIIFNRSSLSISFERSMEMSDHLESMSILSYCCNYFSTLWTEFENTKKLASKTMNIQHWPNHQLIHCQGLGCHLVLELVCFLLVLESVGSHLVLEMVWHWLRKIYMYLGPLNINWGLPYDPICSCLQGVPFYYLIYLLQYCCQLWVATVLKDLTTVLLENMFEHLFLLYAL